MLGGHRCVLPDSIATCFTCGMIFNSSTSPICCPGKRDDHCREFDSSVFPVFPQNTPITLSAIMNTRS